jgi:hypothetical protein
MQRSLITRSVPAWTIVCVLAASLVRTESIVHIAPLLLIWSVAYRHETGQSDALRASAWVLCGWALYQALRWSYFGDLRPNTAVAEGIEIAAPLKALLHHGPTPHEALSAMRQIAREHRAYLVLLGLPLCFIGARTTRRWMLVLLLASLCLTGLIHPLLFGPARLDPVRTTSHVALIAPLLIATQWAELPRWWIRALALIVLAPIIALYILREPEADRFFCCPIVRADPIAESCLARAAKEHIVTPSLANPDLGKISYRKRFLIFDLGLLGSPPLTRLHTDRKATADYLLELAAPDFIEMHGGWVCEYGYLQVDPRFRERYSVMTEARRIGLSTGCGPSRQAGIWFRNAIARDSGSPERKLLDDLQTRLEPERIADELRRCRLQPGRFACSYVARTVYRFIPALVHAHQLDRVVTMFESSPSARYDVNLLRGRALGTWYLEVVRFVLGQTAPSAETP